MANRVVVKSGTFTLAIDTDGASSSYGSSSHQGSTSFQSKYGIAIPADKVPFIVVPLNSTTQGHDTTDMLGFPAVVIDNNKDTHSYAVVGDAGPAKNGWGEVSLKCAWNLGYSKSEANGSRGPNSNFTIYVDIESHPDWSGCKNWEDVNDLINSSCRNSFGGSLMQLNGSTAYGAATSGNYIMREQINWEYLKYYMLTLDRNSPNINYADVKENNVAGCIIEAGYLYNSAHQEVYYRNPKLEQQCISAEEHDFPYGLYCDCKARSIDEARKELYQLSFCIRKYAPVLGMWVHFMLGSNKELNDSIVNYYRDELIRFGLKDSIGILATEEELGKISWKDDHYKDWKLWLNKHVDSVNEIEQLLTPALFKI